MLLVASCFAALAAVTEGMSYTYTGTGATSDGVITLSNATKDTTYRLYKLFDATYDGNNVAYTTKNGSLGLDSDYFTIASTADSNGNYAVTRPKNAQDEYIKNDNQVSEYVAGLATTYFEEIGDGLKATADGSISWNNIPYGYYKIVPDKPATNPVVTINTAKPTATVIDKNQTTTYDKEETVDGSTYYAGEIIPTDGDFANSSTTVPTASVGDTVSYKVSGTWTRYVGTDIVKTLKFTDTMTNGLTADKNVAIKINDTTLTPYNKVENGTTTKVGGDGDAKYTVTYTLNDNGTAANTADDYWVTSIVIPTATIANDGTPTFLNGYGVTNTYEITYTATIDEDAIVNTDEINTVDIKYDNQNDQEQEVGKDKTKVKDYKITLTKVDGQSTSTKLKGAQFKLYDHATAGNEIPVVLVPNATAGTTYGTKDSTVNNVYRPAKSGENGVEMVTGTTGIIEVQGLKNGSYYFEETVAPDGYNKLTARTEAVTITNADATITVDNNAGIELPSTGGIGTTMFYVGGGALVLLAVIFLVTKRRMSGND